jgi:hypothetical protein
MCTLALDRIKRLPGKWPITQGAPFEEKYILEERERLGK